MLPEGARLSLYLGDIHSTGCKTRRLFCGDNKQRRSSRPPVHVLECVWAEAWQVGPSDVDMMAVRPDDNVVIPDSEIDPPVRKLFEMRDKIS
jgi:hypothetical protein